MLLSRASLAMLLFTGTTAGMTVIETPVGRAATNNYQYSNL